MQHFWDYSKHFSGELLASGKHQGCSPVGALLLAALFADANADASRKVAETFGVDGWTLQQDLARLLESPHPHVPVAVALWSQKQYLNADFRRFEQTVPAAVETGLVPSKKQADRWVSENTYGMINEFPVSVAPDTAMVAATALATKIKWLSDGFYLRDSPDSAQQILANVQKVLGGYGGKIYRTETAGLVAVHHEQSYEGVTVSSVMALDDGMDPRDVTVEAHNVLQGTYQPVSLWDLPLQDDYLLTIKEIEIPSMRGDEQQETFDVMLPRWTCEPSTPHDLMKLGVGFDTVLDIMMSFAGPEGAMEPQAKQSMYADYDTYGFEAAAVTAATFRAGSMMPSERVKARKATLRFDRPHVAIAHVETVTSNVPAVWHNIPLFATWVAEAKEPSPTVPW